MRRSSFRSGAIGVLAALTLAGCSDVGDLFTAHPGTAAEAGSMRLPTERLAAILATAKRPQPITREAGEFIAGTWVEYALFAQAVSRGELLTDSASIAEAVWPELAELRGMRFHDTLVAQRTALSDTATDSLYRTADVRVLQHILFGVRPNTPADARSATRRKAEGTLTRVKRGADFGGLASTLSEDGASKADSGYLPPSPRGRFVPAFDSVAWSLAPGQVSGLVETQFGFHIIRRPALNDVRARLTGYLESRVGARLDSLFMDSLAAAHNVEVLGGAPADMRSAAESPHEHSASDKALARFEGGELTVREYLRWVRALPPQLTARLDQANDSTLRDFARVLTQNVLLLRTAEAAGVEVTPEDWAALRQQYLHRLDSLKADMELSSPDLMDSTVAVNEREKIAAMKVEGYFDRLIGKKTRLRPLPSALASVLREKMPYRIHDAGVNRAVELAEEQRAAADTASRAEATRPGPALVPGGPPPVGDTAAAAQDSAKQ